MVADPYSRAIVEMVLAIADSLGASVVAEGIEGPAERDALIALDCTVGQGFYYSMPLAEEDFRWLLSRQQSLPLPAAQ